MPFVTVPISLVAWGLVAAGVAHGADKPMSQVVLECLASNMPEQAAMGPVTVTQRTATGATTRYQWYVYWRVRNDQRAVVIRVTAPMDVAGTAYLVQQTEHGRVVYLKTPAIDGVRRLETGSGDSHTLFGTDVAVDDLLGVARILSEGSLSYMGEANLQGRAVYKMVALPPPDAQTPYSRITAYIGQDPCVIWRMEFSRGGQVQKVYTAEPASLRQTPSGIWYAAEWTVRDVDDNTTTRIQIADLDTTPGFADGRFEF